MQSYQPFIQPVETHHGQEATVFISCSQADEKEKDLLLSHLSVLQHAGLIRIWSDDYIGAGSEWEAEIVKAIDQARIAILLITANFLTSEFIMDTEVPALLKRRQAEGLTIIPIIARPCAWRTVTWLATLKVLPKSGQAIWYNGGIHADEELALIAEEVVNVLEFASPVSELLPRYSFKIPSRQPSLRDFRNWLQGDNS